MKLPADPAPALTRGLALIRRLSVDGQGTLEHLAGRAGWPKSSTLRYLQALEASGVVQQDPATKVWHLRERLAPFVGAEGGPLPYWRGRLGALAQELGQCVELYGIQGDRVELLDRADPLGQDLQVAARIGFRRDLSECDATALLTFAFSGLEPGRDALAWRWQAGEKVPVPAKERRALLAEARRAGLSADLEFNVNGIRRFALALREDGGSLAGLLVIAQRLTPLSARQTGAILERLQELRDEPPTRDPEN